MTGKIIQAPTQLKTSDEKDFNLYCNKYRHNLIKHDYFFIHTAFQFLDSIEKCTCNMLGPFHWALEYFSYLSLRDIFILTIIGCGIYLFTDSFFLHFFYFFFIYTHIPTCRHLFLISFKILFFEESIGFFWIFLFTHQKYSSIHAFFLPSFHPHFLPLYCSINKITVSFL